MRRRVLAAIALLLPAVATPTVRAVNFLEVGFARYEEPGGMLHDVFVEANKDGATTCELLTPSGTYSLSDVGGAFRPGQDFIDDHLGLSFAGLEAAISGGWTLTWDPGASQSVATIDFATIAESDFLLLPILTAPVDGAPIWIPADPNPPTVEWINGSPPPDCDFALVFLADHENWWEASSRRVSDELPCTTTSWTPGSPLTEGWWFTTVLNTYAARDVPVGITIEQGTWSLENSDWLDLSSIDRSQNQVMPTESSSWGVIKASYR